MADVIDTRLRELVKAGSPETREAIFDDLLNDAIAFTDVPDGALARSALLALKAVDARLRTGLPLPAAEAQAQQHLERARELIKLTPEEEAEEAQLIDADEFIRWLESRLMARKKTTPDRDTDHVVIVSTERPPRPGG